MTPSESYWYILILLKNTLKMPKLSMFEIKT